jgi:hypothetical protein
MASRAAPAAAASHVEASLSSLSSDLLTRVANWLSVEELCVFDTAIGNKQLRAKYLSGLSSDTHLYPGAAVDRKTSLSGLSKETYFYPFIREKTSDWQQRYAQWLLLRRVFVNSIATNKYTTATVLTLYDTMNRGNPGLVSLTMHGGVDLLKDFGVRNVKTLHALELLDFNYEQLSTLATSLREWGSKGGSLQKLTLTECFSCDDDLVDHVVDFGDNCDSLTDLRIDGFFGEVYPPGEPFGFSPLPWSILHKCANLKRFELVNTYEGGNDRDLSLLARFCPHLEYLAIHTTQDNVNLAALLEVIDKCTKIQHLSLRGGWDPITGRVVLAIATNLVSLRRLTFLHLKLDNPLTLRRLAHGCPQLQVLTIHEVTGSFEAHSYMQLLSLVEHSKNLQLLRIGAGDHLGFLKRPEYWKLPNECDPQELLQIGVDNPEAFIAEQRERFMKASQPQSAVQRLQAASSNPHFEVEVVDSLLP